MNKLIQFLNCHIFGIHYWTCNAEQNIKPTIEQLRDFKGFQDYAKMYCTKCGKVSKLSKLPYNG